ncbi:hypothetical protein NORO109296_10785 [Nocardiopsis rhodophaea]
MKNHSYRPQGLSETDTQTTLFTNILSSKHWNFDFLWINAIFILMPFENKSKKLPKCIIPQIDRMERKCVFDLI